MGLGCGSVDSFTCHIPATILRLDSRTILHFFSTFMCVAVNMTVHPSSNSFPTYIITPDSMWGKMFAVFSLVANKGIEFSSVLWVACTSLPSRSIT